MTFFFVYVCVCFLCLFYYFCFCFLADLHAFYSVKAKEYTNTYIKPRSTNTYEQISIYTYTYIK